jgi:hypothetical protein
VKRWENGEPLWLSGEVEKNEKINEIERPRVRSPPRATSFFKKKWENYDSDASSLFCELRGTVSPSLCKKTHTDNDSISAFSHSELPIQLDANLK